MTVTRYALAALAWIAAALPAQALDVDRAERLYTRH